MKIKQLSANLTELTINNTIVVFSYETPVIFWRQGELPIVTETKYSVTTSKHIKSYLHENHIGNHSSGDVEALVKLAYP